MNKSAVKTLEILDYIARSDKPAGISIISRELGIPKSSVFDIICALNEKGFIMPANEEQKTYKIGLRAYQIGAVYINGAELYAAAHPVLIEVSKKIGETVYLAVDDGGLITYLDKVESDSPIRSTCNIGSRNYMHITGLGKAILAGYPESRVRSITEGKFIVKTVNTIKTYEELSARLEEIRKNGYAVDNGEDTEMVCCIAAPVRGADGSVIAAISAAFLYVKFTARTCAEYSDTIKKAALEISRRMGYMGAGLY